MRSLKEKLVARMKCPWCYHIFWLTQRQVDNNMTFRCPQCHRRNQGSTKRVNGILIGQKSAKATE